MFHNIIWDVDGTLFDTYPAIARAFQVALGDFERTAGLDWIESLAKVSLNRCMATLAAQFSLDEDALAQAFDAHYTKVKAQDQPPFPGVKTICDDILAQGGKNVIVTHRGRASTERLLAAHDMSRFFAGCLTGDDGYPHKPDPTAFIAALQMYDLNPGETITVGDREIDILGGKAAGLFTCLFGSDGRDYGADLTIKNFHELSTYLSGI